MREKMEMKTHTLAVAISAGWPMALALAAMLAGTLVILPWQMALQICGIMLVVVLLTLALCMKMYLGTYVFLPATEYKGARIIARLGRHDEVEISGVPAEDLLVRQGWLEKRCGVCHIRQKGTAVYLRGVQEPERVKAWIAANFPQARKAEEPRSKKAKKK